MGSAVKYPDYLSYRVRRVYLLMAQRIEDALKGQGIGRSQYQVLSRVARAGTLGQKDLQHTMQVEPATLTGIVDVLVAKGWLERSENADDKRCRTLQLTETGLALLDRVPDPYEIVEKRMLTGLSAGTRAHVESALEIMILNLEDRS